MSDEKRNDVAWREWQDILVYEFERRLTNIGAKGHGMVPVRKNLTALFLQIKGFSVPSTDILPEAIRIIGERRVNDSHYDTIAMIGHRIGMVDNIAGLKQYLQDLCQLLKPEGQVLLTSLEMHAANESRHMSYQRQNNQDDRYLGVSRIQFQNENLIGPFFSLLHIKGETLKSQAIMTNWRCDIIHQLDDDNYLVRLF